MIWLAWKLLTLPIRLVFGTLGVTIRTLRFVGIGRMIVFGAGVVTGLAIAPTAGAEFRSQLAARRGGGAQSRASGSNGSGLTGSGLAGSGLTGSGLADAVRDELAHSPRTWHLPQPTVRVDANRVTLTGEVPHEAARGDLARTAGSVVGVAAVDNRLTISKPSADA